MTWTLPIPAPHLGIAVTWVICCAITLALDAALQSVTPVQRRSQRPSVAVRLLIWLYVLGGLAVVSSFVLGNDELGTARAASIGEHALSFVLLLTASLTWPFAASVVFLATAAYADPPALLRYFVGPLLVAAALAAIITRCYRLPLRVRA